MTSSDAQIAANRRNARRSTGPRTRVGKTRVAGNAFSHGLTAALLEGTPAADRVVQIAAAILADAPKTQDAVALAREAAEASYMVELVSTYRHEVLFGPCQNTPATDPAITTPPLTDPVANLTSDGTRRQGSAGRSPGSEPCRQDPEAWAVKVCQVLREHRKTLERLDRYESRALSRWRRAVARLTALIATADHPTPRLPAVTVTG